ncbi:AraC family transcriptional regulator [Neptunomonas japonica]|uniref:AraC family transcriptional regulator, C-terminal n=1 Tax=Neptunomonas japonica JAMM 1380 TaxID=1441457 RepID=A0A7R6PUS3_9GAMM|nr:GyrI-like domain-containing protein [Neptunomonas japonica]BBB30875.1 AraC family transcriptional regulator, C-terminal [Neptunomonas japonica JAMM 1380]
MDVEIVNFPETKIAVIEHRGPAQFEHESVKNLVAWRIENKLPPSDIHRSYGIHYNDPQKVAPPEYRVDLCVSVEQEISINEAGVLNKVIPALRCAKVRHYGSRSNVTTARYLYEQWLPTSGEQLAEFPIFFHYVNVGPQTQEQEMITDVYLPIL